MATLQNFGVPLNGGTVRGGILQPKPKHRFRVQVFKFGPVVGGIELTQQVVTVTRPTVSHETVKIHSYNSIAYYAGKSEWDAITLTVRDDVTNSVSSLVGHQEQKQMNHFLQTVPLAAANYKFDLWIETLDGGNDGVLETWTLEGCFLEQVNYESFDYGSADPLQIEMRIRYDNATQDGGATGAVMMPVNPQLTTGPFMTGG